MIIVTGGAGLIGSAVIWNLNRLGRKDILAIDHLGTGAKWKNLVPLNIADYLEKDEFLQMITANRSLFPGSSSVGQIEAIFHLGACSATTEQDASYLVKNNFEYTKQLALFAMKHNARFIYASSAATYGDGINGFNDDEEKLAELKPMNMYGYSKHLFDIWARENGLLDKIAGMKYFNVFGPNEYHKGEMRSLVLKAYEQIVSSGSIRLFKSHRKEYADGEQLRDFIYVKDAAAMTIKFMSNRQANGVFNIGGGEAASWNRLAGAIFKALNKPAQIEYIDMPESIRETYQYHTCAETEKIKRSGCWQESTLLEKAVSEYVTEYLVPNRHLGEE
jgi:ADP-L-glycero-D-manno-heptose 6-epimerase